MSMSAGEVVVEVGGGGGGGGGVWGEGRVVGGTHQLAAIMCGLGREVYQRYATVAIIRYLL